MSLNRHYGWVMLSATAIGLQCIFTGYTVPMKARAKVFGKEFMEANFGEIHKNEVGGTPSNLGYPDMGSGKYAEKLPYKDWYYLNNAMRAHYHFVEQVGVVIPLNLMAGLSAPIPAAVLGFLFFGGHLMYTQGYTSGGPKGRENGAKAAGLAFGGLAGLSIYSAIRLLRYAKF